MKQSILVIDDEDEYRMVITFALESSNFEVTEAKNGLEGWESVNKKVPDLILCDINMPVMDGHTLLGKLKNETAFAGIPFLFLTGNSDMSDLRKGMQLGADDYITKPFTAEELIAAVKTRLLKKHTVQKYYESHYDDIKTSIVTSLPHEFRTPLNGILGFSQLLQEENDLPIEEVKKIGGLIHKSAERLHHLLENMVLFGHLQLWVKDREKIAELRSDHYTTLLEEIHRTSDIQMARHERPGAVKVTARDAIIHVSSIHLAKIMDEVIDNALKFSESGSAVTIVTEGNETETTVIVRDEGRGMTSEQLNTISAFQQFHRQYYEQQGAGLGLVIAKSLVELYGGKFEITSSEKRGTTVRFSFRNVEKE
jgi:CheY-like chemotaxis protein/two-component sensor histidine kinase